MPSFAAKTPPRAPSHHKQGTKNQAMLSIAQVVLDKFRHLWLQWEPIRPPGMLDTPGGHWARKRSFPLLRGSDFGSLKVLLGI